MRTTIEQRKEKAVELMKQLQIYKPYINDFKKDNLVTYFERHIGYWAFQDEEIQAREEETQVCYSYSCEKRGNCYRKSARQHFEARLSERAY